MSQTSADFEGTRSEGETESPVLAGSTLFRQRASRRPQALALADRADRSSFGMDPGRDFSYGDADKAIDALCHFFSDHGLEPGDVVGVQMPNVAETPLVYLAAWRRGLTVAAFSHLWHKTEVAEACAALNPAALIGAGSSADGPVTEILRDAAAMHFSVRLVAGFGPDVPDGIADLDTVLSDDEGPGEPVTEHHSHAPALITFTARAGHAMVPIPHSCETLLAQGAMTVLALGLNADDRILNAFPLSNAVGIALGIMPWLVCGGVLIQHHAFDAVSFARQVSDSEATVTALPAPVLSAFSKTLTLKQAMSLKRIGRVLQACRASAPTPQFGGFAPVLFDVHPLGDLACVLLTYMDGADASLLPRGKLTLAPPEKDGVVFVETALSKSSNAEVAELLLRGPAVAKGRGYGDGPITPDSRGFVGTGIPCLPEPAPEPLLRLKRDPELLHHGGFLIATSELDGLYGSFPACQDAACFAVTDPLLGEKVCAALVAKPGQSVHRSSLHWFLKTRHVAPYKIPAEVIELPRIPRSSDGRVMRDRLAAHLMDEETREAQAAEEAS